MSVGCAFSWCWGSQGVLGVWSWGLLGGTPRWIPVGSVLVAGGGVLHLISRLAPDESSVPPHPQACVCSGILLGFPILTPVGSHWQLVSGSVHVSV